MVIKLQSMEVVGWPLTSSMRYYTVHRALCKKQQGQGSFMQACVRVLPILGDGDVVTAPAVALVTASVSILLSSRVLFLLLAASFESALCQHPAREATRGVFLLCRKRKCRSPHEGFLTRVFSS
jgi:hypothetical protein